MNHSLGIVFGFASCSLFAAYHHPSLVIAFLPSLAVAYHPSLVVAYHHPSLAVAYHHPSLAVAYHPTSAVIASVAIATSFVVAASLDSCPSIVKASFLPFVVKAFLPFVVVAFLPFIVVAFHPFAVMAFHPFVVDHPLVIAFITITPLELQVLQVLVLLLESPHIRQ